MSFLEEQFAKCEGYSGAVPDFAAKFGVIDQTYELDGILAKLSANGDKRDLPFVISRTWDAEKGWVYTIGK